MVHRARALTLVLALAAAAGCATRTPPVAASADTPERVELSGGDVLYVIDGRRLPRAASDSVVPAEVRALDPAEILSIQVIKGSEARARFGRDGENGVVVISTRRKG